MNPYREPGKPASRLRQFFVDRARRITPLTALFAALLLAGIALAATPALRLNGVQIGPYGDYYVTAYGADPTGVADSTTAIQAAITAAMTAHATTTKGATVYFPPGKYIVSSPLNAQQSQNLRLEGSSGLGAGFGGTGTTTTSGSTIIYTGTGATSFLQLNSSFGSVVTKLAILYSSASFTGVLIDYGLVTSDASYNIIDECLLGGTSATAWNAKALVSWNKADFNVLKNSHLQGGLAGVRFRETLNDYANANRIEDCLFRDFQTGHIMNAGNNEVVSGNVFEGNVNRGPPTQAPAYTTDITSESATVNTWNSDFRFINNWIGDYPAGTMFDTSPTSAVNAYNLTFEGNEAEGTLHFANLKGASISRNDFGTAVNFDGGGTYQGVSIMDNIWFQAVNFTNIPATAFVKGNTRNSSTTVVGDQMSLIGTATVTALVATATGSPVTAQHYISSGSLGSNVAGTGAGTGPTVTTTGTDTRGTLQVLTGTTPAAGGNIVSVNFGVAFPSAPSCTFTPLNATTAALNGATQIFYASTTTSFTIAESSGALAATTTYKWSFVCID